MMNAFARKGDFWSGLALAALGSYIVSQAAGWTYMSEDGPGAGFFPLWYGGLMVILSLLLVASAVLKQDSGGATTLRWSEMRRAMTCWAALALCVAALKYVGFIIAFGSLAWFIVGVMFRRPHLEALTIAVVGAVGFYLLFSWGLGLTLPGGELLPAL